MKFMTPDEPIRSPRGNENRKPQGVYPDIPVSKAFHNEYEYPPQEKIRQYFGTIKRISKNKVENKIKVLNSKGNCITFILYSFSLL